MNPWPFVIACYAITFIGTLALAVASWRAMTAAERRIDQLKNSR